MARPKYKRKPADAKLVGSLAGFGLNQEQVAACIINPSTSKPISVETLVEHYSEEYFAGKSQAAAAVARTAYTMAVSGSVPAMTMFWLKTQLRWTETSRVEHETPNGLPLTMISKTMTEKEAAEAYAETLTD